MMRLSLLLLSILPLPTLAADTALTECRQIVDLEKRVTCYDEVVDARYGSEPSEHTDGIEAPAPAEDREVPDARSLFGTGDAEARQIVETTLEIEQIEQIEATVSDVRKSAGDKMIVTLDNGQTWRQLDSKTLLLKDGDIVIIRKASFGSFLLEKKSGSRSIRMKRIS